MPNYLSGVRIVSMAQYVPGPLAAARLRDAGARVIKVEPPTGDPMLALSESWHAELHEGIPIERLDLKGAEGKRRMDALLADADVFITSQRPSALARIGFDPEALRARVPTLRLLRIVGSLADPDHAGHDLTYQAQSGILGDEMPRVLAADVMASGQVFAGVLALLRQPSGTVMDVGILEALEPLIASLRHGLTMPSGVLGGAVPRYRLYATRVGRIAVAALEPHFETRLYAQLGLPMHADLAPHFLERTAVEWETWAIEHDLPIVAIRGGAR